MNKKEISLEESFNTAINFHTKGKINEAKKIYEEILEFYPDHFLSLTNLGIIFSQLKDFKKAVELFNKVVKINPKYAEGYNNLGNSFFELSEIDRALESYKKAVQINHNFSDAYNNIGEIEVPLIVRLEGTNAVEAKQLIDGSGLKVKSVILLQEAADKVAAVLT